jgi:hypothetical protein
MFNTHFVILSGAKNLYVNLRMQTTHPVIAQPLNLPSLPLRVKEDKNFSPPLSAAGEERSTSAA